MVVGEFVPPPPPPEPPAPPGIKPPLSPRLPAPAPPPVAEIVPNTEFVPFDDCAVTEGELDVPPAPMTTAIAEFEPTGYPLPILTPPAPPPPACVQPPPPPPATTR